MSGSELIQETNQIFYMLHLVDQPAPPVCRLSNSGG